MLHMTCNVPISIIYHAHYIPSYQMFAHYWFAIDALPNPLWPFQSIVLFLIIKKVDICRVKFSYPFGLRLIYSGDHYKIYILSSCRDYSVDYYHHLLHRRQKY